MRAWLQGFLVLLGGLLTSPSEIVFYVSLSGNDSDSGNAEHPFATLDRARQAIRLASPDTPRKVVIRNGIYSLRTSFTLGREDSGTTNYPVTWQAAPGETVRLVGGLSVNPTAFKAIGDATVLARLAPEARTHVLEVDLRAMGVADLPPFPISYHGVPPGPELFFNDTRMSIARWPNQGWTTIARIVESGSCPRSGDNSGIPGVFEYSGDRPARWRVSEGVWLQGYWCYDWFDAVIKVASIDTSKRQITLAAPHLYSLKQGNPSPRRYRALNVLEELDEPGEYIVDRLAGRLYFWPPSELTNARITLSTLDAPLVVMRDTSYVTLKGLVVESGLDDGITVVGGTACEIASCAVRNMRRIGVRVTGGTQHRVSSCDIHLTGQGGVILAGGDRKTLTPAGHDASNNHIWSFSELQLTSAYGLAFEGVGNRASHNLIHNAPHVGIHVDGNDHVFEFNEIHHICTETDDCGAFYKGRNPSCRGNIVRFNYWHDIGSSLGHGSAAVYFDDGDGGDIVIGNVFVRCGDPGKGPFGAVFSHGGHDIMAENNVFIDCKRALGSSPWDDALWRNTLNGGQDAHFKEKLLHEVDITKPPYTTRYPELVGFMNPPVNVLRENHARLNMFVNCGEISNGNWHLDGANWSTMVDPGFVNGPKGDYRLRKDSPVFKHLTEFKQVPFDKIGLSRN